MPEEEIQVGDWVQPVATELTERLAEMYGPGPYQVIRTYHASAASLILLHDPFGIGVIEAGLHTIPGGPAILIRAGEDELPFGVSLFTKSEPPVRPK